MVKRTLLVLALAAWPSAATAANLIVTDIWAQSPVIVYELPEADGRAEAIRYIESLRDKLKQGATVLDAGANPDALKEQLKKGFILYTTLGDKSRLLRAATRQTGWDLAGGEFHWRDVSVPAAALRLVMAGKNPYSKGYCVVLAAASNRTLAGINELDQGLWSYHIFQGDQLLREGMYDQTFVPVERLSRAEAMQDAQQFFTTLRHVHPKLLGKVTENQFRELRKQTISGIETKLDAHDEIALEDLASLLYYAGAYFHDGHTSVHWWTPLDELHTRGKRFPAFRLTFDNGRVVIAAAKDRSLADAELLAVNGVPAMEFLRPILDRCSGETAAFRSARFVADESFWYFLTNLFGSEQGYRLKIRDAGGEERDSVLETLPYAEYRAFRESEGGEPYWPNRQGIKVEFPDSGATAHFLFPSFLASQEARKKIDQAFEEVKARGSHNLILDIRGNGGGESSMAEHLFRYLYAGKFRSFRQIRFKASWEILPLIPWFARPMGVLVRGHVFGIAMPENSAPKPAAFFQGRVYLLVNGGSFSMASSFATMVRDYKVGTILGYETGGMPVTFGGPYHFTLKHSRIPCTVSWTQNFPPMAWPGDEEHGVIPDVPLNAQRLAEFSRERDPVLAFTLRYVHSAEESR